MLKKEKEEEKNMSVMFNTGWYDHTFQSYMWKGTKSDKV